MEKSLATSLFTLLVISLMIFASEFTGENEIIFPEVAALCAGAFLSSRLVWKTTYLKMILCISICAILGVLIVIFVPFPLWIQFSLAFALGQIVLFCSRTSFAPMISAISLPVLIQTRSLVYIGAAFSLTVMIVALGVILEKADLREKNQNERLFVSFKEFAPAFFFRTILIILSAFLCIRFGVKFCVAPPLLVAFTELTNKNSLAAKRIFSVILLVFLCALLGAATRFFLTMKFALPLTVSAFFATVGIIALVKAFRLPFPPAAAMCVLAMLIPESEVVRYPIEVLAGISVMSVSAWVWKKSSK